MRSFENVFFIILWLDFKTYVNRINQFKYLKRNVHIFHQKEESLLAYIYSIYSIKEKKACWLIYIPYIPSKRRKSAGFNTHIFFFFKKPSVGHNFLIFSHTVIYLVKIGSKLDFSLLIFCLTGLQLSLKSQSMGELHFLPTILPVFLRIAVLFLI